VINLPAHWNSLVTEIKKKYLPEDGESLTENVGEF
jgi:hypothetical protein